MALDIVRLNSTQAAYAERIAQERQRSAVERALPDRHGFTGDGLTVHRIGACGEMAVAAWLYGDEPVELTVDTFRSEPDLPGGIEVRTRTRTYQELYVRNSDDWTSAFVLVSQAGAAWWLRGWIPGVEAARQEWLREYGNREPAHFVPHAALYPMELLRERLASA